VNAPSITGSGPFKVVEINQVTDQSIEETLNEWCPRGWELRDIRFVLRDASRRPAMAFVIFEATPKQEQS